MRVMIFEMTQNTKDIIDMYCQPGDIDLAGFLLHESCDTDLANYLHFQPEHIDHTIFNFSAHNPENLEPVSAVIDLGERSLGSPMPG